MGKIVGDKREIEKLNDSYDGEQEALASKRESVAVEAAEFTAKTAVRRASDKSGGVRSDVESLRERCRILFDGRNVAAVERYLNEQAGSMDGRDRYEILVSVVGGR